MNQLDQSDEKARGWSRGQITFRLTPDRVAQLRRISESLPVDATVNDALDRAISVAIASADFCVDSDYLRPSNPSASANVNDTKAILRDSVLEERLDAMQAAIESMETTVGQVFQLLATQIRQIHSLMSVASSGTDLLPPATSDRLQDTDLRELIADSDAMPFGVWMEHQIKTYDLASSKAVAIKATKLTSPHRRSAAGPLYFSCILFATNGKCLPPSASESTRGIIRVERIAPNDPLSYRDEKSRVCFWCIPSVNGWKIHAYILEIDGTLGRPLGRYSF